MLEISALSDGELTRHLRVCVDKENQSLADLIVALAEFDKRKLYAGRAYCNIFIYCTKALGYSEDAAFRRIQVAQASRNYPSITARLRSGALSLTAANLIAPHLNSENHRRLIDQASGKSKREVETLVASLAPKPVARDMIRTVAAHPPPTPVEQQTSMPQDASAGAGMGAGLTAAEVELVRIAFTATAAFHEKLKRCRDLLSHKYPFGQLEGVFEDALDALLKQKDPENRPHRPPLRSSDPHARKIPRWVRDKVWRRDQGRCGFMADDGRRCNATAFLEFDHKRPWSLGGRSNDPENIRLLCRTHNLNEARVFFGEFPSNGIANRTGN